MYEGLQKNAALNRYKQHASHRNRPACHRIPGSGVAGFQPAVFDNKAGEPTWSPFWNHHALKWIDESKAKVIRSSAEIRELVASGDLEQFNGVPDSHPNGFVVNCLAPILAPNNFAA